MYINNMLYIETISNHKENITDEWSKRIKGDEVDPSSSSYVQYIWVSIHWSKKLALVGPLLLLLRWRWRSRLLFAGSPMRRIENVARGAEEAKLRKETHYIIVTHRHQQQQSSMNKSLISNFLARRSTHTLKYIINFPLKSRTISIHHKIG